MPDAALDCGDPGWITPGALSKVPAVACISGQFGPVRRISGKLLD
jgi:hypothetical protein